MALLSKHDAKTLGLTSNQFAVEVDASTGAVTALRHPGDPRRMNWISSARENSWALGAHGWGLGYCSVPGGVGIHRWQAAESVTVRGRRAESRYRMNGLLVRLVRQLAAGGELTEELIFENPTRKKIAISGASVYLSFNDNYPDARTCLESRCHAHIWCGCSAAHVCALRMGGAGPHLGFVLTEGRFDGYSIEGRGRLFGSSNQRGAMAFNLPAFKVVPGASHRLAWQLFWHEGWDDFHAQLATRTRHIDIRAERYTLVQGRKLKASCSRKPHTLTLDGKRRHPAKVISPALETLGEHTLEATAGKARATLKAFVVPPVMDLLKARARFILDRQQVTDRRDPLYGAILCYDNLAEARVRDPHWGDQNEGRERLGMGVFLAQMLERRPDRKTAAALLRYHSFVRNKLQTADYRVLNGIGDYINDRLYNYAFFAQFQLKLYRAFGDKRFLRDFYGTMRAYYRRGGVNFYAFPIPILEGLEALGSAGMKREETLLRSDFLAHADRVARIGDQYPPHEVNFEQTIVSPGALILLEAYLVTRDAKYLPPARRQLELLETFQGHQPDYRLNEIPIRHWDGYWFGKLKLWGDTFPHYWSAVSGWTFYRAWQVFNDERYRRIARTTLMNNLCLFTPEGRASCAYIYPDAVNGEPARKFDPLANDQDWALVFLLDAGRLDPDFVKCDWGAVNTVATRRLT